MMLQSLTILLKITAATPNPAAGTPIQHAAAKNKIDINISLAILDGLISSKPPNENLLKDYVDNSLVDALMRHKRTFLSSNSSSNFDLLGKFLDKNLNPINICFELQKFGNSASGKKVVDYDIAVLIAYYCYLLKSLINTEALPLIDGEKCISFDKLYSCVTRLIPDKESQNSKTVLDSIDELLNVTVKNIKKYWKDDLSELVKITASDMEEIDNFTSNYAFNGISKYKKALNEMYEEKQISFDAYVEIVRFHGLILSVSELVHYYIKAISTFRVDRLPRKNEVLPNPIQEGWMGVKSYLSFIRLLVRELFCIAVGFNNHDKFSAELEPEYKKVSHKDKELNANTPSSVAVGDSLLEMFIKSQPFGLETVTPKMAGDKINGIRLVFEGSGAGAYLISNPKKDTKTASNSALDRFEGWTMERGVIVAVVIIMIICIAGYMYSKYYF